MAFSSPHFLLFSEGIAIDRRSAQWRFALESIDEEGERIVANDFEPGASQDRLELIAVVRGLEALGQPSRVTLVTKSRYVSRTLSQDLGEWRENNWRWERFGRLAPVRHADLWRRIDHALDIHDVDCRTWRFDVPRSQTSTPTAYCPSQSATPCESGSSPRNAPVERQNRVGDRRRNRAVWLAFHAAHEFKLRVSRRLAGAVSPQPT